MLSPHEGSESLPTKIPFVEYFVCRVSRPKRFEFAEDTIRSWLTKDNEIYERAFLMSFFVKLESVLSSLQP